MKVQILTVTLLLSTPLTAFPGYLWSDGHSSRKPTPVNNSSRATGVGVAIVKGVKGGAGGAGGRASAVSGASNASANVGGVSVITNNDGGDIPWYGYGAGPGVGTTNTTAIGQKAWAVTLPVFGGGLSGTSSHALTECVFVSSHAHKTGNVRLKNLADKLCEQEIVDRLDESREKATRSYQSSSKATASGAQDNSFVGHNF